MTSRLTSDTILLYLIWEKHIGTKSTRLNQAIRAPKLRVIGPDGEQIGVVSREEALAKAQEAGLDLAEMSPDADPPVAKILDWGKYNYRKTKQAQKAKKKSKALDLKQMRFSLKIGQHDRDIKLKKVREFLSDGHKVRLAIRFKGREMAHKNLGYDMLDELAKGLADLAVIEQEPVMAGRQLSIVMRPNAKD